MVEAKIELAETVFPLGAQGVQLPLQPGLLTSDLCSLAVNFVTNELKLSHGVSLPSETASSTNLSPLEGWKSYIFQNQTSENREITLAHDQYFEVYHRPFPGASSSQ